MKYDALLMLSGGKDSCALAFKLKEEGQNVLAFTLDHDFLSRDAKSNILKITTILDMDSVMIRPKPTEYQVFIAANATLTDTCTKCSLRTMQYAIETAKRYGINIIYAGFTKYTSRAHDMPIFPEFEHEGLTIRYPYAEEYKLREIKKTMQQYKLEYDAVKTNCNHISTLLGRDITGCIGKELDLLFEDGQMDKDEYDYYRDFIKSCGAA